MKNKLKIFILVIFFAVFFGAIGIVNALNSPDEENNQALTEVYPSDEFKVQVKEKQVKAIQYTKIERDLDENLKKLGKNGKVRVAIWVKADEINSMKRPEIISDEDYKDLTENNIMGTLESESQSIKNKINEKQKPIKDKLKSKNINIIYKSTLAPVIFAEVSRDEIRDLEADSNVVALQLGRKYEPLTSTSVPTILAPPVWPYVISGTKVAVIEANGIAFANPYLKDGIYCNPSNTNIGSHPTAVAGIIASTHTTYKGVAYKGPAILSGNANSWDDYSLMSCSDWAVNNGARVISNSWGAQTDGVLGPMAYYYDWLVYNYGVTVVFAAGNNVSAPVYDPAVAYNVISVGSFNDKNTGSIWWDDEMSYFSSYINPPSSDREEPDVVAPGDDIISTTTFSPWVGNMGSGTSYAAPHVSGGISLLINKTPALGVWPEAVRAIMMASADHNIDGNSRLSDKDGAGGINILEAYRIGSVSTKWRGVNVSYDGGAPWYSPNITANMGQRVRAVIAWDSRSTGYNGIDALNADLDLSMERLSGKVWVPEYRAGISQSYDNNFEILDFNAPVSGKYRAKVNKSNWIDNNYTEHLGYAVYIK